jgi:excisionase family DNA binding protein
MFFRSKRSGSRTYLQLVENQWKGGRSQQRVIATVGRLDKIVESGELESLVQSASKFCKNSNSYFSFKEEVCLSSHQASRLLQVSPSTVVGWINQGKLEAFRTPGGHRRVRVSDLRRFLLDNGMPLPPELGAPAARRRVFVVDDDPMVFKVISRAVARLDDTVAVDGCEDGIKALVLIGALQPDLVLLDIYMEGLDGFEVCRRLRQIPNLQGLKIVAMTAHPSPAIRARILDHGAYDFWVKPVSAEKILALLDEEKRAATLG